MYRNRCPKSLESKFESSTIRFVGRHCLTLRLKHDSGFLQVNAGHYLCHSEFGHSICFPAQTKLLILNQTGVVTQNRAYHCRCPPLPRQRCSIIIPATDQGLRPTTYQSWTKFLLTTLMIGGRMMTNQKPMMMMMMMKTVAAAPLSFPAIHRCPPHHLYPGVSQCWMWIP